MISLVWCVATALWVVGLALFIYWLRDKPTRRPYLRAGSAAFGLAMGLQALAYHLGDSPRWMEWYFAAAAVALIGSVVWDALSKAKSRQKDRA